MYRYTATFADGTTNEIKKSRREYSHGWKVTEVNEGGPDWKAYTQSYCGFSSSKENAERAARAVFRKTKHNTISVQVVEATRERGF